MKNKKQTKLKNKSVLLLLALIYVLITILATTSYISTMNNISSTPVTFSSVIGAMWWQILMIILFIITYVIYARNERYGALVEMIMGISMLAYIIVSIISIGINLLAIVIELIYPVVLIVHGIITFKVSSLRTAKSTK